MRLHATKAMAVGCGEMGCDIWEEWVRERKTPACATKAAPMLEAAQKKRSQTKKPAAMLSARCARAELPNVGSNASPSPGRRYSGRASEQMTMA